MQEWLGIHEWTIYVYEEQKYLPIMLSIMKRTGTVKRETFSLALRLVIKMHHGWIAKDEENDLSWFKECDGGADE